MTLPPAKFITLPEDSLRSRLSLNQVRQSKRPELGRMDMPGGNTIMRYLVTRLVRIWGEEGVLHHHLEDLRSRNSENSNTLLPIHSAPHSMKENPSQQSRPPPVLALQLAILPHLPTGLRRRTQQRLLQNSFMSPPQVRLCWTMQTTIHLQGLSAAGKAPTTRRKENMNVQFVGKHSCDLQDLQFIISYILGRSPFCVQSHPADARHRQTGLVRRVIGLGIFGRAIRNLCCPKS